MKHLRRFGTGAAAVAAMFGVIYLGTEYAPWLFFGTLGIALAYLLGFAFESARS